MTTAGRYMLILFCTNYTYKSIFFYVQHMPIYKFLNTTDVDMMMIDMFHLIELDNTSNSIKVNHNVCS